MNLHELDLDDERRRELDALLSGNAALRQKLTDQSHSAQDRALQILSIVRAFDETMYDDVCLKFDPGLPPFSKIIDNPGVQPVPRVDGKYWLRESLQNYWLNYWNSREEERKQWTWRFASWLEINDEDPAERLALLLRVDSHEALQLLSTVFERANAEDDLNLCHSLVQQVDANLSIIDQDLRPQFESISARYRGRARFLREYQRTISYYPRETVERDLRELIKGDGAKWIFYLSAAGGMGKTMFVHRTIAHELLKKAPFPFVARIDLDDIEVAEIAKTPWLVAIEIAEELDEQLTQPLFAEQFLSDVKIFSPLLYRIGSNRSRTLADEQRYRLRSLASEQFSHWAGFVSRCMELPRERPLVIFIDTIEEASLHWPAEFRRVLERFEELHAALPQLRLVLTGRYPLSSNDDPLVPGRRGHFFQYDDALRGQTKFDRLEPFDSIEAAGFIRSQLPEVDSELMQVMISAAGGNPFKLRMLCETISKNPDMTASKLKEYGSDVDLAYLIKRVIERIPVGTELGLRWLLRYGALPRRLTYSFLQEVLQPLLVDALSGKIEEANEDIPSPKEREAWLHSADVMLEPEHLWERLARYVSDRSWISMESRDARTATLHPDVVKPMRRLLKEQPIFGRIHREALIQVENRKTQEAGQWIELTLASLFHRIQLGEADLVTALNRALDERPLPDDVASRLEVLREIVKSDGDFSDAPSSILALAHYEIADAIAIDSNFDYLPSGARREDIRRNLERAVDLNRSADVRLPSFVFRWRDFLDGNIPGVWNVLTDLVLVVTSMEGRSRYLLLLSEIFAEEKISAFVYSILWGFFGGRTGSDRIPGWALMERAAQAYKRRELYPTMERYLRLSYGAVPLKSKQYRRIQAQLLEYLVKTARLRDADEEMTKALVTDPALGEKLWALQTEIHLGRRDAWSALAVLENVTDKTLYRFHHLRARALGQLLRVDEAAAAFAAAMQAVSKSETPEFIDDVRRDELIFRLFEAGLPTEPSGQRQSRSSVVDELELIRAFQLRSNTAACERILDELKSSRHPIETRLRATIAGVSWGIFPSKAIDEAFTNMLTAVGNSAARCQLMEPPVLLGRTKAWQLSWLKRLELRNRLETTGNQPEMMDSVRYGRALLAMGDRKRADAAFSKIVARKGAGAVELAVYRQRCLSDSEVLAQPLEFWSGLASEPSLYVVALVENAERAIDHRDMTTARQCLEAASDVVKMHSLHPVLSERCIQIQVIFDAAEGSDGASTSTNEIESVAQDGLTLADYSCILLAADAQRLLIEMPGGENRRLSIYENEALSILARYSREASPRRLAPVFLSNWPALMVDLHEPFADLPKPAGRNEDVVLLALGSPSFVAVPWELSLPPSSLPIRIGNGSLEGPVVDEIRRPKDFHRVADSLSGLFKHSGAIPSIGVYRVPYSPSKDMIAQMSILDDRLMASNIPISPVPTSADIIYIMSDIEDSPSIGEPQFPNGMTGALMGREIQRRRMPARPLPFVVLHSPLIGGVTAAIEQTFARNRLAQALVNSGAVSGVLAIGITNPPENPSLQDTLIDYLWRAKRPMDIMRNLRGKAYPAQRNSLEEMLGVPASALFLNVETSALQSS